MYRPLIFCSALLCVHGCLIDDDVADRTDADGDGVPDVNDCAPNDSAIHPSALETCNGVDDDCNGTVDGADAVDALTFYIDDDGDGFGGTEARACTLAAGLSSESGDCDDSSSEVHPERTEKCNGVDDDCNGAVDDGLTTQEYYQDLDGDGFGTPEESVVDCAVPAGHVNAGDDCDDTDANIHPGAEDAWYDGLDSNCDDADDYDQDADGHAALEHGGDDCLDTDETTNPSEEERCDDGIDNNCDGSSSPCTWSDVDFDSPDVLLDTPHRRMTSGLSATGGSFLAIGTAGNPGAIQVFSDPSATTSPSAEWSIRFDALGVTSAAYGEPVLLEVNWGDSFASQAPFGEHFLLDAEMPGTLTRDDTTAVRTAMSDDARSNLPSLTFETTSNSSLTWWVTAGETRSWPSPSGTLPMSSGTPTGWNSSSVAWVGCAGELITSDISHQGQVLDVRAQPTPPETSSWPVETGTSSSHVWEQLSCADVDGDGVLDGVFSATTIDRLEALIVFGPLTEPTPETVLISEHLTVGRGFGCHTHEGSGGLFVCATSEGLDIHELPLPRERWREFASQVSAPPTPIRTLARMLVDSQSFALGDFNNDGRSDLAVVGEDGIELYFARTL